MFKINAVLQFLSLPALSDKKREINSNKPYNTGKPHSIEIQSAVARVIFEYILLFMQDTEP
jgi:hypothetical protein